MENFCLFSALFGNDNTRSLPISCARLLQIFSSCVISVSSGIISDCILFNMALIHDSNSLRYGNISAVGLKNRLASGLSSIKASKEALSSARLKDSHCNFFVPRSNLPKVLCSPSIVGTSTTLGISVCVTSAGACSNPENVSAECN